MMRILLFVLALAFTAPAVAQEPAPRSTANLWLDVIALGRDGGVVTDMRADEFEVWISGFRVPIADVIAVAPEGAEPRTLVVILDNAAVPPVLIPRVREAARLLVTGLGPNDRMAILPLHGGALTLTSDRATLLRAIDTYQVRSFPFRIEDAGEHVLQTIAGVSRQLAEAPGRRKTIVAIGAGWMFDTPLPPPGYRDLGPLWVEAMRTLASARATLYVIDPAGLGPGPRGHFGGASGFARETGGHAFLNTNDFRGAVERIWRETSNYYLLGVVNPPVQRTADLRELEVRTSRKDVTLRARREIRGR